MPPKMQTPKQRRRGCRSDDDVVQIDSSDDDVVQIDSSDDEDAVAVVATSNKSSSSKALPQQSLSAMEFGHASPAPGSQDLECLSFWKAGAYQVGTKKHSLLGIATEDTMDPVNDEYGVSAKNTRYASRSCMKKTRDLVPTTTHQGLSSRSLIIEKKKTKTGVSKPARSSNKKTTRDSVPTTHQGPSSRSRIEKKKTGVSKPPSSSNKNDILRKEFYNDNTRFLDHAFMRASVLRAVSTLIYGTLWEMQDMVAGLKSKLDTHEDSRRSVASYLDMQMREMDKLQSKVTLRLSISLIKCPPPPIDILRKEFDDVKTRILKYGCIRSRVLGEVRPMIYGAMSKMHSMLLTLKGKLDILEDRRLSVTFYLETQRELLDSVRSEFKLKLDTADLECRAPPIA